MLFFPASPKWAFSRSVCCFFWSLIVLNFCLATQRAWLGNFDKRETLYWGDDYAAGLTYDPQSFKAIIETDVTSYSVLEIKGVLFSRASVFTLFLFRKSISSSANSSARPKNARKSTFIGCSRRKLVFIRWRKKKLFKRRDQSLVSLTDELTKDHFIY